MTTTVECYFVTPMGVAISNAPVEFQPAKSGFIDGLAGIIMPRAVEATTDLNGECTVELWPSPVPYYVRCSDLVSDAEVFYKILVSEVPGATTVRLQDLVIDSAFEAAAEAALYAELAAMASSFTVPASEALAAGDLVNIWVDAGTAKVRKADGASISKSASGFVLTAVALGVGVAVYSLKGKNTAVTGLTPGPQWLSATQPGKCSTVIPSTAGHIVQSVGFAISATVLVVDCGEPIERA